MFQIKLKGIDIQARWVWHIGFIIPWVPVKPIHAYIWKETTNYDDTESSISSLTKNRIRRLRYPPTPVKTTLLCNADAYTYTYTIKKCMYAHTWSTWATPTYQYLYKVKTTAAEAGDKQRGHSPTFTHHPGFSNPPMNVPLGYDTSCNTCKCTFPPPPLMRCNYMHRSDNAVRRFLDSIRVRRLCIIARRCTWSIHRFQRQLYCLKERHGGGGGDCHVFGKHLKRKWGRFFWKTIR